MQAVSYAWQASCIASRSSVPLLFRWSGCKGNASESEQQTGGYSVQGHELHLAEHHLPQQAGVFSPHMHNLLRAFLGRSKHPAWPSHENDLAAYALLSAC